MLDIIRSDVNVFSSWVDFEGSRDEMREKCNFMLTTFMKQLYERKVVTPDWVADNLDLFVCSAGVTACVTAPLFIKQVAHFGLYMKALKMNGTEKHREQLIRAAKLQDKGCFCMTELAHGSNVQGIRTTATYDPETKEFILNTPD